MLTEILKFAQLSKAAYRKSFTRNGIKAEKYGNWLTSTTFFVYKDADTNYLIFRGSSSPRDILIDVLAFPPVYYLRNWMHAGFALQHKSVKKKLLKVLREMDPDKELVITGHSLAAALGEITKLLCDQQNMSFGGSPAKLCVFGKPRAFLKPGKNRFKSDHVLSVCSASDLIIRVPKYCYTVGSLNQNFLYFPNDGESALLNPDPRYVKRDWDIKDCIKDHSIDTYIERIKAIK